MPSGTDASHVGECRDEADCSMSAHSKIADIVEEYDCRGGVGFDRFQQQCADHHLGTTWLAHYSRSKMIELSAKPLHSPGNGTETEVGAARNHYSGGLSLGMRVDHNDRLARLHDNQ